MSEHRLADWLPADSSLNPFYDGVKSFVKEYLTPPPASAASKEAVEKSIVDPTIGYIHLNPWEVSLLDTKLFQRLKKVRQLGLAFQIFPTLAYSRFEHTLGVIGRLAQVLNKLIETHRRVDSHANLEVIIPRYEKALRFAALFHDVGHCIFSHVSETVISELPGNPGYPAAREILESFTSHFQPVTALRFAEVLSLTILGTGEVYDFLEGLEIRDKTEAMLKQWLRDAGRFILGLPAEDEPDTLFLAQLMNSGFDVDKLDYMTREAHFSGIKLGIDLDRILDKLRVFVIGSAQLPSGLAGYKRLFEAGKSYRVLGFARGGQFSFEEFCVARVALYDKIYLHQKVRAAEGQLANYLRHFRQKFSEFNEAHRWLYLRESYLEHPNAEVPTPPAVGVLFSPQPRSFAGLGLTNIDDRALYHRAFAFGPANSLTDPPPIVPVPSVEPVLLPSLALIDQVKQSPDGFLERVAREASKICDLLHKAPPSNLRNDLIVDLPRPSNVQQGINTIYFERPTRLPLRWTMPIDRIVDYYMRNRALAYVFSSQDDCALVMLAAEKVVWEMSKGIFVQEGTVSSRVLKSATALRKDLSDAAYYDDAPALRPLPRYLVSAEAQEMIVSSCTLLARFESYSGQRVTSPHMTIFLAQFPDRELQAAMLRLFEHVKVVDVSELAEAIAEEFSTAPVSEAKRVAFAPLGSTSDSATHLSYYLRSYSADPRFRNVPDVEPLADQLDVETDHIVLFDDNANSGLQALNIVADWLGETLPDDVDLKERHVPPLGTEAKDRLRKTPISLVFAVGTEGADRRVKDKLAKYLGIDRRNVRVRLRLELRDTEKIFSGPESKFQHENKKRLRDFLRQVGERLMLSEGKSADAARDRALGYGGAEALIVFPYNVPTMTIPALWCSAEVGGKQWIPLVERRRRLKVGDRILAGEDA